jgi:hypothetical protein
MRGLRSWTLFWGGGENVLVSGGAGVVSGAAADSGGAVVCFQYLPCDESDLWGGFDVVEPSELDHAKHDPKGERRGIHQKEAYGAC